MSPSAFQFSVRGGPTSAQNAPERHRLATLGCVVGCVVAPWAILGWMVFGNETIGQDYVRPQVLQPLTYRFYASLGVEPLWSMFTGGIPIGGLALTQMFHLPAWLLSRLPGYWTGHALTLFAIKHLLLLASAHLVGYFALRRLTRFAPDVCFLLSFATLYQLRTVDWLRFGPALDAFVYGYCALLLSLVYWHTGRRMLLAAVVVLVQLFATAGYPPMLLFLGLAAALALGLYVLYLRPAGTPVAQRIGHILMASTLGVLLAAPNWLLLLEWLEVNHRRVRAADLAWADYRPLSAAGLLSNLLHPWTAEIPSAFGGTTLFALLLLALFLEGLRRPRRVVLSLSLALPLAYAFGGSSPVFRTFYHLVPGFSTLRAPGRVTVALVPLLLIGTAVAWSGSRLSEAKEDLPSTSAVRVAAALMALALVATLVFAWMRPGAFPALSPEGLSTFWSRPTKVGWIALGLAVSMLLFWGGLRSLAWRTALIATTVAQAAIVLPHGTWTVTRPLTPTWSDFVRANHLPLHPSAPLRTDSHLLLEEGAATATTAYTTFIKAAGASANCFLPLHVEGAAEPVLLPFYLSRASCVRDRDALWREVRSPCPDPSMRTLVIGPRCAVGPTPVGPNELVRLNRALRLLALTPNLVEFEAETNEEAVLVTPFPWMAGWRTWIDGARTTPIQVNGAFVAAAFPAGRHRVRVAYVSRYVRTAYRVFYATLLVVGVGFPVFLLRRRARRTALAAMSLLFACLIAGAGWYQDDRLNAGILRELTFNNNFAELLREQLARWDGH